MPGLLHKSDALQEQQIKLKSINTNKDSTCKFTETQIVTNKVKFEEVTVRLINSGSLP